MEVIGGFIVCVAYIAYFVLLVGVFINCSKKHRTSNRQKYIKSVLRILMIMSMSLAKVSLVIKSNKNSEEERYVVLC